MGLRDDACNMAPGGPVCCRVCRVFVYRRQVLGARPRLLVIRALRTGACHKTLTSRVHSGIGDELRDSRRRDDHDFGQATPDVRAPPRSWSLAFLRLAELPTERRRCCRRPRPAARSRLRAWRWPSTAGPSTRSTDRSFAHCWRRLDRPPGRGLAFAGGQPKYSYAD
jgi:hypothetical protein